MSAPFLPPAKPAYETLTRCRVCGGNELIPTLDLGEHALAGTFPTSADAPVTKGPLRLVRCGDPTCGLVQLDSIYSLEEQYGDNYGYRSGLNQSMVTHLSAIAVRLQWHADEGDMVLDIGSNDGTLLGAYTHQGLHRVGFDPTIAKFGQYYKPGIAKHAEFFSAKAFKDKYGSKKAAVVTSISMFYDLPDPVQFARDVAEVLAPGGVWFFEQSYVGTMVERLAYDTVCHEHLEYYGIKQVNRILEAAGFVMEDVTFNDTNGGSFAVAARRRQGMFDTGVAGPLIALEETQLTPARWKQFRQRVREHGNFLFSELRRLSIEEKVVHGLGASTKGNTLLQYAGVTPKLLSCIAEVNPDKFGCFTPGTGIPIVSEEESRAQKPDYYLVLPWHFREGFLRRHKKNDPRFLFPLPEVEVMP